MTDSRRDVKASCLDRLLDRGLYAPLGFVLTSDKVVAELAKTGREQVTFARSLGRAALSGLAKSAAAKSTDSKTSRDSASRDSASKRRAGSKSVRAKPTAPTSQSSVPGYVDMTAREVIALVATCSASERAWLRDQEERGKKRVTVLRAIEAHAKDSPQDAS